MNLSHRLNTGVQNYSMNRTIFIQGYLLKLPDASKKGFTYKAAKRRYFVFGILENSQLYLEYYTNEEAVYKLTPLKVIPLQTCKHVACSLPIGKYTHILTIVLEGRVLNLVADDRSSLDLWHGMLKRNLTDHDVLQHLVSSPSIPEDNSEGNVYDTLPTRNPTSPLPIPPACAPAYDTFTTLPGSVSSLLNPTDSTTVAPIQAPRPAPRRSTSLTLNTSAHLSDTSIARRSFSTRRRSPPPIPTSAAVAANNIYTDITHRLASRRNHSLSHVNVANQSENDYITLPSPVNQSRNITQEMADNRLNESLNGVALPSYTEREEAPAYTEREQEEIYEASWVQTPARTPLIPPETPLPRTPFSAGSPEPRNPFFPPTNSTPLQRTNSTTPATPMSPLTFDFDSTSSTPAGGAMAAEGAELPEGAGVFPDDELTVVPPKMMEALGLTDPSDENRDAARGASARAPQNDAVVGWNAPPPTTIDAPPPYVPKRMLSIGAQKSLKLNQVERLQKEMSHSGGIKVTLRRVDCFRTIACVDYYGSVWVVGWMQKLRPFLSNALHIGDQVLMVNGVQIDCARTMHKIIKHCPESEKITMVIKRLPNAKVYAVARTEQRQDIGVICQGATAEILTVEPFGLAAMAGLVPQATSPDGNVTCNWWITEVNHRSLNLFYKNNEVQSRLNAVGLDLSFVVQPIEFVSALKKQLKTIKNYKDFIVQ